MKFNISLKTLVLIQGVLIIGTVAIRYFMSGLQWNISFLFIHFYGWQLG